MCGVWSENKKREREREREREGMVVILECCGRKSIINICLYLAGVAVKDAAATSVCLLHYHYSILFLKNTFWFWPHTTDVSMLNLFLP